MSTALPGSAGPRIWSDEHGPDTNWGAPYPAPTGQPAGSGSGPAQDQDAAPRRAKASRWRTPLILGSIALALALVVTVVWGLGGFGYRQDRFTRIAPGTTWTTGPYEFTFTEATVQHVLKKDTYDVIAVGTGRTTGDESITLSSGQGSVVAAQDVSTREVQFADDFRYGSSNEIVLRANSFTPGLAPIPFSATFTFTKAPADTLRLVVFDLEFTDNSVFGDQDPSWNAADTGRDLRLPIRQLPDRDY